MNARTARRLVVSRQRLAGPRLAGDLDGARSVLRSLRCVQLDPINVVARSHLLVLWSRLGVNPDRHLEQLLWRDRWLFEYWAHAASLVLTEDYPIHAANMAVFPPVESSYGRRVEAWLAANDKLRKHILDTLRAEGPLPTRAFDDHAAVGWESSGWTDGRSVERMLEFLWRRGEVMVGRRDGTTRLWDLRDNCLPATVDRTAAALPEAVTAAVEHALRALGVARPADVQRYFIRDYYATLSDALGALERAGRVVPVRLADDPSGSERWYVHRDVLPELTAISEGRWAPRTVLLSPFDNLISDRKRTARLWGFDFRNEMYTPKHKRQYGYYLMPILHGERLVGRISPRRDPKRGVLVVDGVFLEPDVRAGVGLRRSVTSQIASLARLVGAHTVEYGPAVGREWTG
ncbi:winged helix-turn-helix domain-containing protein [Actinophytocola sp.]|uniref:winged helix-turn-helix domain-containing protein n=1 Tax=Actinophytocola sp. TaxID=1872138 RepID=UPI003D6BD924